MKGGEVRTIRRAIRDREGVLRGDAVERLRHVMRRAAARVERREREAWT